MLRNEFSNIINDYGSYYVHVSQTYDNKCQCYNYQYQTAKDECLTCLGTGNPIVTNVVKGRSQVMGKSEYQATAPGDVNKKSKVFYLQYDCTVSIGDYILTCDFANNKPVLGRNSQMYLIDDVEPSIGLGGKTQYIRAWGDNDVVNSKIKINNLSKLLEK